jgi:hypothetical protein
MRAIFAAWTGWKGSLASQQQWQKRMHGNVPNGGKVSNGRGGVFPVPAG